jgi:hypothetical protein
MNKKERKSLLQAEIEQIELCEDADVKNCIKAIMNLPESKLVSKLLGFKQSWKMKLEAIARCEFYVIPFGTRAYGSVFADIKEPKGHCLYPFFTDCYIGNNGMAERMELVSPAIKKQFKKLHLAENALKTKAIKIADKYGFKWNDICDKLCNELCEH